MLSCAQVELFKFGPRGTAKVKEVGESDGLTLVDVIATGTNADGSTFSDNISILVDSGKAASGINAKLVAKLDELANAIDVVSSLMAEVEELRDEEEEA